jgi:hypothetical protein
MVVGCVSGRKKKKRRNTGAAIQRSSHCDLESLQISISRQKNEVTQVVRGGGGGTIIPTPILGINREPGKERPDGGSCEGGCCPES